jgi:hypothetical protein
MVSVVPVVAAVVKGLPAGTRLALRTYGHQSPRRLHDCDDTQLLVPFGTRGDTRGAVIRQARGVVAQGYTPITRALELAVKDFPASTAGARFVVLVSDGKETCEGDPCATARVLDASGIELVIHTVGFDVDRAARTELECMAASTGGRYFDARDAAELARALGEAMTAPVEKVEVPGTAPGNLEITGADLMGHEVVDAATGKLMGEISATQSVLRLPPGIYNATFGEGVWRGVRVEAGKTTTLQPAVLTLRGAGIMGHRIADSETGLVLGEVSSIKSTITLLPGTYDVTFGNTVWPMVKMDGGTTTTLNPGVIHVAGATLQGHMVRTRQGREVGSVSSLGSSMPLPPGSYTVDIEGKAVPFTIAEGARVEIGGPVPVLAD